MLPLHTLFGSYAEVQKVCDKFTLDLKKDAARNVEFLCISVTLYIYL